MNHTLKITSLLFILWGYQKTEEDKHPEIPIFLEHSNKISIKQFSANLMDIKYNEKNLQNTRNLAINEEDKVYITVVSYGIIYQY